MILPFSILIFGVALSSASPSSTKSLVTESRIVGGTVSTDFIPYQIALYISDSFSCGGSLITNKCVLTAAHCVSGKAPNTLKIRAGIRKLSTTGGGTRKVYKTFIPSGYNATTLNYDIAILKLAAPINGTNISPIPLNTDPMSNGDLLTVSGWGLTNETGTVSDSLQYVVVPAIPKAECNAQYGGSITNTMFCAGTSTGGMDACSGDSGGPVVKDGKQYGIVSWGYGCARANFAGVYTNVKQLQTWINRIKTANC